MSHVWIVEYRAAGGSTMSTRHADRQGAVDVMVDSLIESALQLWTLAESYRGDDQSAVLAKRGDFLMEHALKLVATTEGSYELPLPQGRRWLICEAVHDDR